MTRTRPLPQYLKRWYDKRTRKTYLQFRKRGHELVPLPQPIGSDAFWAAYNAALKGKVTVGVERSISGSISSAIAAYYASNDWTSDALSDGTRGMHRPILERFRKAYGEHPLQQITENFIEAYIETMKPHSARNHLKALRRFLRHAKHDVTRNIRRSVKSKKHPSWPVEVMAQYEAHHPIGSKARLAFALARYTGAGRSEILRMGPQHMVGDVITIARKKTGVTANIVVWPELRTVLDATPLTGLATFLVTKTGKQYGQNDLSDQFRQWCNEAGIPSDYSLHGLRHAMGDMLAETGSNPNQIASVLGHADAKTALSYTRGADRKRMAREAMEQAMARRNKNTVVSEVEPPQTHWSKKPA